MRTPVSISLTIAAALLLGAAMLPARAAPDPDAATVSIPAGASFQVSPMKLELAGRPGALIPFAVEVAAGREARTLAVRLFEFRQEESGALGIDEAASAAPAGATLEGSGRIAIPAGGRVSVRGRIHIAAGGPAFRAIGLLVSELGAGSDAPAAPGAKEESRLEVRYMLRYGVRIEVRVTGAREPRASALRIVAGGLADRGGRALARITVENPTDGAIELSGEAQLLRGDGRARLGPWFPLSLPAKASRSGPERIRAFVLPGARVRLEDLVPEPVAPGSYVLVARLAAGSERVQAEFAFEVAERDFPAQRTVLPRVVGTVAVSPPRIALALHKGGARIAPLTLENRGDGEVTIRLSAEPLAGAAADWLVVRPETLTLPAGATRRVAVTMRGATACAGSRYAFLRVDVAPRDGAPGGAQRLPVALSGFEETAPLATAGEIEAQPVAEGIRFTVPVKNEGTAHLVLDGTLTILDPFGRKLEELPGGFGAWVLPGESGTADFALDRPLAAGEYRLRLELRTGPREGGIVVDRTWRRDDAHTNANTNTNSNSNTNTNTNTMPALPPASPERR